MQPATKPTRMGELGITSCRRCMNFVANLPADCKSCDRCGAPFYAELPANSPNVGSTYSGTMNSSDDDEGYEGGNADSDVDEDPGDDLEFCTGDH